MYEFNYRRAGSVEEAVEMLAAAEDPKVLSGGMTLLPTMKQRLAQPSDLVDISHIEALSGIREGDGRIVIGAVTRHAEVAASAVVARAIPALAELANHIGDAQVRNRGTLGGSVANADPAADYPAALLALSAEITTNQRTIRADDFFLDLFETALEEHELVTSVSFAIPQCAAYMKFPNPASRYAIVGVMVAKFSGQVRVAVTGAGANAFRYEEMEQALTESFSPESLEKITLADDELNSDIHASAPYRAHLVGVMARRAVAAAQA
jgi:carbon-monoxide dehydrogenase medium subunit